eukprot:TRINITY_DN4163_c0_g1_i1.p1 TRINITY_DN4163_c0_g1~~TRINITY_DN4163_c0_g1_i1.p1  ORF type:complete len:343 (+),score=44.99 TRINITY_DN4163_c0_g1_i1:29-1057(+)
MIGEVDYSRLQKKWTLVMLICQADLVIMGLIALKTTVLLSIPLITGVLAIFVFASFLYSPPTLSKNTLYLYVCQGILELQVMLNLWVAFISLFLMWVAKSWVCGEDNNNSKDTCASSGAWTFYCILVGILCLVYAILLIMVDKHLISYARQTYNQSPPTPRSTSFKFATIAVLCGFALLVVMMWIFSGLINTSECSTYYQDTNKQYVTVSIIVSIVLGLFTVLVLLSMLFNIRALGCCRRQSYWVLMLCIFLAGWFFLLAISGFKSVSTGGTCSAGFIDYCKCKSNLAALSVWHFFSALLLCFFYGWFASYKPEQGGSVNEPESSTSTYTPPASASNAPSRV